MKTFLILIIAIIVFSIQLNAKNYTNNYKTIKFIDTIAKELKINKHDLEILFSNVTVQNKPLNLVKGIRNKSTPALKKAYPKYGHWDRYKKYKITPKRISQGIDFIKKHKTTFNKVEKKYGVPAEYISAIIGIESVYGGNVGKFPVFDTLTTLAFETNRRNKFFTKQLKKFIELAYKQKFNPKNVMGSYTGAIGLGQFMPSNYEAYGVDFNNDGKISLQHPQDAIASIANYLKKNGWRKGELVATRVSYKGERFKKYKTGYNRQYKRSELKGIKPKNSKWNYNKKVRLIKLNRKSYDELWYGAKNFYVITRYNHSAYYAMSVHQLANEIDKSYKL